jgi:uncharacterized protein
MGIVGTTRAPRGLKRLTTIFGILVAAALAWITITVIWLWWQQERVVFQPPRLVPQAPASARRVDFAASDGHPLFGFVVAPRGVPVEPRAVVVAFHGNADLSVWLLPWASALAEQSGATVFLPEYRGYGGINGSPTYASTAHDARGALAWARAAFPGARVVLFGHSLGSAVAAELALAMEPERPAALVLQSPFTSAQAMATRMLIPPIPALWTLVSRVHFDTRAIVSRLDAPVWVAHGTRDVVIPARMGRAVHDAALRKGELLLVPGAGHNDVADVAGDAYWRWLSAAVSPAIVELEQEGGRRLP